MKRYGDNMIVLQLLACHVSQLRYGYHNVCHAVFAQIFDNINFLHKQSSRKVLS